MEGAVLEKYNELLIRGMDQQERKYDIVTEETLLFSMLIALSEMVVLLTDIRDGSKNT